MTLFDRFTIYALLLLAVMTTLLLIKPMLLVFMIMGLAISFAMYYLITHPILGRLMARVVAESLGLLLMLAFFVSLLLLCAHILNIK